MAPGHELLQRLVCCLSASHDQGEARRSVVPKYGQHEVTNHQDGVAMHLAEKLEQGSRRVCTLTSTIGDKGARDIAVVGGTFFFV